MVFSESSYKNLHNRLEINLTRNSDELLTSWEISNFISQFSSAYYKNELLNTISLALNAGILPENIFIMDESFNYNYAYADLDTFSLDTAVGVQRLYHLGKPVSLVSNDFIFCVNTIFDFFRRCNETLYRIARKRVAKGELCAILSEQTGNMPRLREALGQIRSMTVQALSDFVGGNHSLTITQVYDDVIKRVERYEKDQVRLDIMKKSIYENDLQLLKQKAYTDLASRYMSGFFREFANNSRPVVGIYYSEKNRVQILCNNHINKTKRDARFLDLKQISHNSPYVITIIIGISVAIPLFRGLKYALDQRRLTQEGKAQIELEGKLNAQLDTMYALVEELANQPEFVAYDYIPYQHLKDKIIDVKRTNDDKLAEPLRKYGFDNQKVTIQVPERPPVPQP